MTLIHHHRAAERIEGYLIEELGCDSLTAKEHTRAMLDNMVMVPAGQYVIIRNMYFNQMIEFIDSVIEMLDGLSALRDQSTGALTDLRAFMAKQSNGLSVIKKEGE